MYNNINPYGYYNPYSGQQGYNYGQPKPKALMTQPVTNEEMKLLRQDTGFSLAITPTDKIRAKCTHKKDGNFAFVPTEDGKVICEVCGATWDASILPEAEVAKITENMIDILQQIKAMYLDMPASTAEQFFTVIPLLEKVPQFYKLAHGNFNSHEQVQPAQAVYGQNGFAQYAQIAAGLPAYGTPGYVPGTPMAQPYGVPNYQQPVYPQAPGYGTPTAPVMGENPFAYGAPAAPMVPPVQPMMPTVPAAPAAPTTQNPVAPQVPTTPVAPAPAIEGASKSFDV